MPSGHDGAVEIGAEADVICRRHFTAWSMCSMICRPIHLGSFLRLPEISSNLIAGGELQASFSPQRFLISASIS